MSRFSEGDSFDSDDILVNNDEVLDEDSWATELKLRLENAMEIWIASAFVDTRAVDILESALRAAPPNSSREIRILLDNDFHENPLAREVIINKLYSLPNTIIRLADTKGKFHPKCYIFNQGSYTSALVGSMNFTGGALINNTEFGIFSDKPDDIKKCKGFFLRHWSKGKITEKTERLTYTDQKFKNGDTVSHTPTQRIGSILNNRWNESANSWEYHVFFGTITPALVLENDLKRQHIFSVPIQHYSNFRNNNIQNGDDLKYFILSYLNQRYLVPAENGFYGPVTSRIQDVWYQKIPLYKVLDSPSPRLLIADEVGLGKTIEAGLILKELMARMIGCKRILIVCPNMLSNKWEQEMRIRFNIFFEILTGKKVADFLNEFIDKKESITFNVIIPYESLGTSKILNIIENLNTPIDIIICDEAHHLRNDNLRHATVRKIAFQNRCMLMLTATPINLNNRELRVLLGILDPNKYGILDPDKWDSFITPNSYISKLYSSITDCILNRDGDDVMLSDAVHINNNKLKKYILKSNLYGSLYNKDHKLKISSVYIEESKSNSIIPISIASELADNILTSNVFSQSISRTLKRDVGEFNQRDVKTIKISLDESDEKLIFLKLIALAKKTQEYNKTRTFAAHAILHQASSCLPVVSSLSDIFIPSSQDNDPDSGDADAFSTTKKSKSWTPSQKQISCKDSKFAELEKIIFEAKNEDQNFKVIIFCMFIKTIKYLEARIKILFGNDICTLIYGDVPLEERLNRINSFSKNGSPNILISSEVASEGVDLQFCHILVNYDLPWNPTKVEQRIGRIDRFGQKSDKVIIFNLVLEGTIEEIIYFRLGQRLEDAKNTLGPVAEVLGKMQKELPEKFLRSKFSDAEKERYTKTLDYNLKKAKEKQSSLEKENLRLVVHNDTLKKELESRFENIVDNHNNVPQCLLKLLSDIFIIIIKDQDTYLKIKDSKVKQVTIDISRYLIARDLRNHLNHLLPKLTDGEFKITFDRNLALNANAEYLCIDHPFIRFLLESNKKRIQKDVINFLTTKNDKLLTGKYILTEYECAVAIGPIKQDFVYSQSAYTIERDAVNEISDRNIIKELFKFDFWNAGSKFDISEECLKIISNNSRETAEKTFSNHYDGIKTRLIKNSENQKNAYNELCLKNRMQLEQRITTAVNPNQKKHLSLQLDNLVNELNYIISSLPNPDDIIFSPRLILITAIERR
ncbi:MAG: helicase [Candidatus Gottesmanbacteria bacterium GW2011_GWC2_39_8]|uniref:Helicase n=1 Tax=Candidatus Gottesmanbacteria bacterium GW2011_GWC2_39_8 TaxID=1618450 RepID=A0A0G0Q997_9BACT|nr:MAG: helicase [Candidatus Gottesmanbacteria bacterium GW2011_GWC2_39_8]